MLIFFIILIFSRVFAYNCFQENADDYNDEQKDYYDEQADNISTKCSATDFLSELLPKDIDEGKNLTIRKYVSSITDTQVIFNRLANLTKNVANVIIKPMQPQIVEFIFESGLSPKCLRALMKISTAIQKPELWALQFLDTSGGLPKGITYGGDIDFGLYDHCVAIESSANSNNDKNEEPIRGQYCILEVIVPLPKFNVHNDLTKSVWKSFVQFTKPDKFNLNAILAIVNPQNIGKTVRNKTSNKANSGSQSSGVPLINFGVCVPSQCTAEELENAANKALFPVTRLPLEFGNCSTKQPITLDAKQLVAVVILGLLALIVIISTLIELLAIAVFANQTKINSKSPQHSWIVRAQKLSLISNTGKLFGEPSSGQLPAVDTLRLYGIFWIFLNHAYLLPSNNKLGKRGLYDYYHKVIHTKRYFFLKFFSIIEIFPLISGFVTTLSLMRGLEKSNGKFNFVRFVLNRYVKFTIALNGYLIFIYLQPLTGSGPLWPSFINSEQVKSCDRFVNNNLLYYQNYLMSLENQMEYCIPYSWTIVVLMHLHLIAPLIVLPLYYRPKLGLIINIMAIILGLMLNVSPTLIFDKQTIQRLPDSFKQLAESATWYYVHTEQYVTTYAIGIFTAFLAIKYPKISVCGKLGDTLLWLILPMVSALVVYWHEYIYELAWKGEESIIANLLFISIGKVLLASSFAWICYASYTNRGKFFLGILGNKYIQPFARLSFSVYMLQHAVIYQRIYTIREPYDFTDANVLKHAAEDFMLTMLLSYVFYIIFECPVYYFYGLIMENRKVETKTEINGNNNLNGNSVQTTDLNHDENKNIITLISAKTIDENSKF